MKIRSLSQLADVLDNDLQWRRRELVDLQSRVVSAGGSAQRALIRSSICMTYAHLEGSIKFSTRSYLYFLNSKKVKLRDMTDNFLVIHMWGSFKGLNNSSRYTPYLDIVEECRAHYSDNFRCSNFEPNTSSNLDYAVFVDICKSIGVAYENYAIIDNGRGVS